MTPTERLRASAGRQIATSFPPRAPSVGGSESSACGITPSIVNAANNARASAFMARGRGVSGPAPSVGAPALGGDGSMFSDCSSDSECNSGNCLFGTCAPGLGSGVASPVFCGSNEHLEGFSCVCDVGYARDANGNCVFQIGTAQTGVGDLAKAACLAEGKRWVPEADVQCWCPEGQMYNTAGDCVPDYCAGKADGDPCVSGDGIPGACGTGLCINTCIDELGNSGTYNAESICVGTACGTGQGRGLVSQRCMACGDNGFEADGVHCAPCPKGLHYVASSDTCECDAGTSFDANWNCVNGSGQIVTPPVPPAPQCGPGEVLVANKCVANNQPPKCDPRTQEPATDANGQPYCKAKADKPAPEKAAPAAKSNTGMIVGLLALAAAAGIAVAVTAKKRKKRAA